MSLSISEINLNIVQFKRVNTKWYRNEILESQFSITSKKLTVAKKTLHSIKTTQFYFDVAFCLNSVRHIFGYF